WRNKSGSSYYFMKKQLGLTKKRSNQAAFLYRIKKNHEVLQWPRYNARLFSVYKSFVLYDRIENKKNME
ncbi:hypothetical protein ABER02_17215, partial [Rossellomorea marisflavi]|uniref:hypothetical protein n=1 Tax=Rossellomorea marisflavi TaxID=189381 RepID=UPI003D26B38D